MKISTYHCMNKDYLKKLNLERLCFFNSDPEFDLHIFRNDPK